MAQRQDRPDRAVRPRRRPGRRLVHGAFLHVVLHPEHSAGRPVHHQRARRLGADRRRRLRRRLRQPVRPHRPQAVDPRRLRARRPHLLPTVRAPDAHRQPGALSRAERHRNVMVIADPADCSFQFNPTGSAKFSSSCDIAKSLLAKRAVHYTERGCTGRQRRQRAHRQRRADLAQRRGFFRQAGGRLARPKATRRPGHPETVKHPHRPGRQVSPTSPACSTSGARRS